MELVLSTIGNVLSNAVQDECSNLIISVGKNLISKAKTAHDWKKLFIDSGKAFLENETEAESYLDNLSNVLSKANMKELAKRLKKDSGYSIEDTVLQYLVRSMAVYGIPHDRAIYYAKHILLVIVEQLRNDFPEKYDKFFQKNWRDEEKEYLNSALKKVEGILTQLSEFKDIQARIESADQIDKRLLTRTILSGFGLEFFTIDDDSFKEEFSKHRNDEVIYVKCRCAEEAIYCIINELWCLKDDRAIFVVKGADDWKKLYQLKKTGSIYIPNFIADEIDAIPGNTNIFVMPEYIPVFSRSVLELRPRTFRTISDCLVSAGMPVNDAYKLVSESHGLYVPMMKKLVKGVFPEKPNWVYRIDPIILKTAMLIGQWKDCEGDKAVIEVLSGIDYNSFLSTVLEFAKNEEPFIHVAQRYGEKTYCLASVENTWAYEDVSIEDDIWERFIQVFLQVINSSENLYSYDNIFDEAYAKMKGEKLFWSDQIRSGMIRTLIIKAYYMNDEGLQRELDRIVQSILNHVDGEEKWKYVSSFFSELCELSPDAVIERLNKEFEFCTGFTELFKGKKEDFLFGKVFYLKFLSGIEQFLSQRKFVTQGMEILFKLDNLSYDYKSNSPKSSLQHALSIWGSFTAIRTVEEKIAIAKRCFSIDRNAWDLIYSVLPSNQEFIVGELSKPSYRDYEPDERVTANDFRKVSKGFLRLLLKNMNLNPYRWKKVLKYSSEESISEMKSIIAAFLEEAKYMDDESLVEVKDEIRAIIYRNRYHCSASWALSEEYLKEYEALLSSIIVSDPALEYEFYFNSNEYDFPLLSPVPFDSDANNINIQKALELIESKTKEFKEKKLDLKRLADYCSKKEVSSLGRRLADYWSNHQFDYEVFRVLISSQKSARMAYDYYYYIGPSGLSYFDEVINVLNEYGCQKETIALFFHIQANYAVDKPRIYDAEVEIKKAFWRSNNLISIDNYRFLDLALSECFMYGTSNSYIRFLFFANERLTLDNQYIFNHLVDAYKIERDETSSMDEHYLSSLLKPLQKEYCDNQEKAEKIGILEIAFAQILKWEDMVCCRTALEHSPDLFAEIVSIVFKKDDGTTITKEKQPYSEAYYSAIYRIYDKLQFCPAEKNGMVDENALGLWISRFEELLKKNNQSKLKHMLLGRLFSFSPPGKDGFYPCEAVRRIIEENYHQKLSNEYQIAIENSRGVHYFSGGKEELKLAEMYKQNADCLAIEYPKTASIYYSISKHYKWLAREERKNAENEF